MALPAYELEESFLEKDEHTEAEYFAWEERSPHRWEFLPLPPSDGRGERRGVIRAMSGGIPVHGALAANLIISLAAVRGRADHGPCQPYGSDLKVHCADGRNTYPDVTVACEPLEFYMGRRDIILNPVLIAEVVSPSTESDDASSKRRSYQTILSLQYYLLIGADETRVEMYTREGEEWRYQVWNSPEALVPLPALGITLPVAELYFGLEWQRA